MTSASAAIVDSVTWPDPRSSCSLAGNYQVPWPLAQRLDGMSFATIVGPLPVCPKTGNRFILTCIDLATHYPETTLKTGWEIC